jgi:hypothetical protein
MLMRDLKNPPQNNSSYFYSIIGLHNKKTISLFLSALAGLVSLSFINNSLLFLYIYLLIYMFAANYISLKNITS